MIRNDSHCHQECPLFWRLVPRHSTNYVPVSRRRKISWMVKTFNYDFIFTSFRISWTSVFLCSRISAKASRKLARSVPEIFLFLSWSLIFLACKLSWKYDIFKNEIKTVCNYLKLITLSSHGMRRRESFLRSSGQLRRACVHASLSEVSYSLDSILPISFQGGPQPC